MGTVDARGIGCALLSRVPLLEARIHTAVRSSLFPSVLRRGPSPLRRSPPLASRDRLRAGPRRRPRPRRRRQWFAHFKSNRALPLRGLARRGDPAGDLAQSTPSAHLRSLVWRAAEALFVRGLVDDVLAADPTRHVVVAGDLNDHPTSHVLRVLTGGGPTGAPPLRHDGPREGPLPAFSGTGRRSRCDLRPPRAPSSASAPRLGALPQ